MPAYTPPEDYPNIVRQIVAALGGNKSKAARRLNVAWPTVDRWTKGTPPRNGNDRRQIETVAKELGL